MTSLRHPELPESVQRDLARVLAESIASDGPLPVTFATESFAPLLDNWLHHTRVAGVARSLVVAMDGPLADRLARDGTSAIRHGFDGTLGDFWYQRALVFEWLAGHGVDFIHSDVDAVWLKDPRPFCFADPALDLIFSQGINYPADNWLEWDFVLCCGLFAARANPATARFFADVRSMTARVGDDQAVMNALLLNLRLAWRRGGIESYPLTNRHGQMFTAYRQMLKGAAESAGLTVGLLPHDRVPRLPVLGTDALVRHPVGPGDPVTKLRAVGCWAMG